MTDIAFGGARHGVESGYGKLLMSLSSPLRPTWSRPSALDNGNTSRALILSVDDEPVILYTREIILQREGYEVLSARNGEDALRMFAAHAIDLVLLDYVMPVMDGRAVAEKMKQHKPQVPVIMVSANHVPDEALACVEFFLAKGNGPVSLLNTIRRVLSPDLYQRSA